MQNEKEYANDLKDSMIEEIISSAGIGIWQIALFDNEPPRMRANTKMRELLGLYSKDMSEEQVYEEWFSKIKKSALPSVLASVEEMQKKGKSENTYAWIHPTQGEIYVRCGGIGTYVEGKGYILRGYHSDVTDIINSDTKQKQQLADALDEVRHQKKLLQEALDNYKQADYDRRRDYLTGLRNRQDMYELLNDDLSELRNDICAMVMIDVDNFKMLNDNYGHKHGDICLVKISEALRKYGKENRIYFYRYGGEEILGICFSADKAFSVIAEEIVQLIRDLRIERDDVAQKILTISLGYTSNAQNPDKMIDYADKAMYTAKSSGRNRAVCYEEMK